MSAQVGRIHSIQSLGTVDGPGIRFVAFLQGCPLRCGCCHNPDTHSFEGGTAMLPQQLCERVLRYREYFGQDGGITLSGGEPLCQAAFCYEVFALCRQNGICTCLDTSGCLLGQEQKKLLSVTDRVLLDVKYTTEQDYQKYVGCSLDAPLSFLAYLQEKGIPTTLRQVVLPTLNDSTEQIERLRKIARAHSCVDGVELLPFRKLCTVKYEQLGRPFPFAHLPEPTHAQMQALEAALNA